MSDTVKDETSSLGTATSGIGISSNGTAGTGSGIMGVPSSVTSTPTAPGVAGTGNGAGTGSNSKTGTQAVFIHKLYNMLEDESLSHLIWWCENSDDSFMLIPNTEFSKALSIYFKHSNIASFVRQLNMYGFHKVNDSNEAPVTNPTTGTNGGNNSPPAAVPNAPSGSAGKEETISTWEFKHNSGFFKKGDLENLKNIKRRSSKNVSREINTRQLKIQNYIPKNYDEEELNLDNQDFLQRLNDLNYNFNVLKNDHLNLTKKYDLAIEDLKKTNYDLLYLLDLIKDISNNSNQDLDGLLNKFRANILHRNSLRENDLANLSVFYNSNHSNNPHILDSSRIPPSLHPFSRVNSLDSITREPAFINKDIRYSSISSSSKRHHSILYDPLTAEPFTSRHNSQTAMLQRQQQFSFSPVSPGQPASTGQVQTVHTPVGNLPPPPPPPPPPGVDPQQQHYFQDYHAHNQQTQHPPHLHPHSAHYPSANGLHRNDSNTSLSSLPSQHQPLQPQVSSNSIATYNSVSSSSIPIANTKQLPSFSQAQAQDPRAAEHPIDTLTPSSANASGLNKLQPPFEASETGLRRGRSDSVSDRVMFKRSKS